MININLKQELLLANKYRQTAGNFLLDKFLYQNKVTPYPRLISCFITERCNFNCPMCHVQQSRLANMAELDFKDFVRIVQDAKRYYPSFQLTGGEPLLHPQLPKIIHYLTINKIVKGLVTNGLLLEERASDLVRSGLDFLAVSLDGPDEKTQYKRGLVRGSFSKLIRGVEKIIRERGSCPFPNIRIATVVTKENIKNFEQVLSLAQMIKADQWSLSHYFYYFDKIKDRQLEFSKKFSVGQTVWGEYTFGKRILFSKASREKIKSKYQKIKDLVTEHGIPIRVSFQSDVNIDKYYTGVFPSLKSKCTSPYNQVFVRGNGDIEICQGYIIGNIKHNKLSKIWRAEKAEHFRNVFAKNPVMPACFRCCALDIKFD